MPGHWARAQQLQGWQLQRLSNGRQLLSFKAGQAQWQTLQGGCDGSNPQGVHCLADSCQTVQRLGLEASQASGVQSWLAPKAPDLEAFLAGRPDDCGAANQLLPWQGELPQGADPACWALQLTRPCQSEQTPAEYLKPHWRANQLVLLLPADTALEPILNLGLQLLEETRLRSTGERLVRLLKPPHNSASLDALEVLLAGRAGVLGVQKDLIYFTLNEAAGEAPALLPATQASGAEAVPENALPRPDPLRAIELCPPAE